MTDSSEVKHYLKKFGNKAEVFEGKALQTRGGLKFDDLYVNDEGILKSRRQKLNKEPEVIVEEKQESDDDDSGDDFKKNIAISKNNLKIQDLKEAIKLELIKHNLTLPKGCSKWKRLDWVNKAIELKLVEV